MNVRERQDSVIAEAESPDRKGVDYFLSLLQTEPDQICRWHAIQALGRLKDPAAIRQLVDVLAQPDTEFDESSIHRITAWSLGQIGPSATVAVLTLLKETDSKAQVLAALDAVGELHDAAAIPLVAPFLKSGNRDIVIWAALALGKIGAVSLSALASCLDQADGELVYVVVDTLAMIGTEATAPVLAKAVTIDKAAVAKYFADQSPRAVRYSKTVAGSRSPDAIAVAEQILVRHQGATSSQTE